MSGYESRSQLRSFEDSLTRYQAELEPKFAMVIRLEVGQLLDLLEG